MADTPSQNTQNHKTFWSYVGAEELASFFTLTEFIDENEVSNA